MHLFKSFYIEKLSLNFYVTQENDIKSIFFLFLFRSSLSQNRQKKGGESHVCFVLPSFSLFHMVPN